MTGWPAQPPGVPQHSGGGPALVLAYVAFPEPGPVFGLLIDRAGLVRHAPDVAKWTEGLAYARVASYYGRRGCRVRLVGEAA
jgi:hypothetical protein